ncbi:UDP-2,4-diacetamido-2,4,6-trideoxy-beta-L-altropyranose hydrolase [Chromohalobacter marismortui]|uniref:UDP-2,4-diacetamido-2,4, 6-trideoxy-beta-L-altropyranose hydrolase n=1 Tax=Chromohalobacter marismortui TaxID=42055 RepID=A0A4R7NX84_9GAMM|nr:MULTISPECIES: UDP-2,4-diacetamido-2,4,6-trideoxy-beta-L-altropyranose hydrolase [Chromohalobacter]MCI0510286.1 UDP-2,4-diacetamido-2,4,6-trideoxy-beta-L-altropyranose hydrolase [Chromohalobacter sp.]TDU25140.1 UDP-2,4-diacetamido-2,4,6-trideoxy-beta-L-altropyranose hydrolase [Chromohalobacter marismortui]
MTSSSEPMRVVFRADASLDIGTGHVMRCLTLADALSVKGVECCFISRDLQGNLIEQTRQRGYTVHVLPALKGEQVVSQEPFHASWLGVGWEVDAAESLPYLRELSPTWLVLDHYALDSRWEAATREYWQRLFVIDDLADRAHIADVLLDQNLGRKASDYEPLLPTHAQCLVGPQYALLRPEFSELRPYSLERRKSGELRHILISLGGVDKDNATGAVLRTLRSCPLPDDCTITVIMGSHAPHLDDINALAAEMPWPTNVAINVNDMAKRMAEADLAIGAAGSTSWERCCLGLPSLMLILADNQKGIAEALHQEGVAYNLGRPEELYASHEYWSRLHLSGWLTRQSEKAAALVDGRGASRLVQVLVD